MMRKILGTVPRLLQNSRILSPCNNIVNIQRYRVSFLKMKNYEKTVDKKQEVESEPVQAELKEDKETSTQKELTSQEQAELAEKQRQQQEDYDLEVKYMHEKHNQLQTEISSIIDLPFKLYGWLEIPETKAGYIAERCFAEHRIPKHLILDHLNKIYCGTLYSMANSTIDEDFLYEYCEKNFAERLIKTVQSYRQKGYVFKVEEDVSGIKGEPVGNLQYFIDMVAVRGLSVNRSENLTASEYHKYTDIPDMGLVIYTPLSLTDPIAFIDPIKNKTIYEPYRKMVLRTLVYIRSPLRLRVYAPDGTEIKVDDNMYTWEHIAVFETQMIPPPYLKSFYKQEIYLEWLGKFNFGSWKLVDLDNWMQGNPLIVQDKERVSYKDPIFKGSKYDPEATIDIRNV